MAAITTRTTKYRNTVCRWPGWWAILLTCPTTTWRPNSVEPSAHQPTTANSTMATMWSSKRSEEHTSELQSLMRISYAVFCLKKKRNKCDKQEINYQHKHI